MLVANKQVVLSELDHAVLGRKRNVVRGLVPRLQVGDHGVVDDRSYELLMDGAPPTLDFGCYEVRGAGVAATRDASQWEVFLDHELLAKAAWLSNLADGMV